MTSMYNEDSKITYAIVAILIVVLGGVAYFLRSNSVDAVGKNKVSVITETKIVDTNKINSVKTGAADAKVLGASTTVSSVPEGTSSTTNNNKSTNMTDNTNTPKAISGAILHTNMGDIEVAFTTDSSKETVINFATLVSNKFYEGVRFHRVIKGFMIQAGDPLSKDISKKDSWGSGGPGYAFKDELSGKETYSQGTLAMANAGPNTNGSQFFIVTANPAPLPPLYTVFGKVVKGLDIALKIENVKTGARDVPVEDVIINSVELK